MWRDDDISASVAEIFREAQITHGRKARLGVAVTDGHHTRITTPSRGEKQTRQERNARCTAHRREVRAALRAARLVYAITSVPVHRVLCDRCGNPLELREGCARPPPGHRCP